MAKAHGASSSSLGREAWIAAGLAALSSGGVEAVRVEVLARALHVTKGSFYWHFADRRELLDAIVAHWETTTTGADDRRLPLRRLVQARAAHRVRAVGLAAL